MAANDPKCPLCFVYLTPEGVCPNKHCPIKKVEYCNVCGCYFLEWVCANKRCLSKHPNVTERHSSLPPTVALPYEVFARSRIAEERTMVRGYSEMLRSIHPNHPLLNPEDDDVTPCHFRSSLMPPDFTVQESSFQQDESPMRRDRIESGTFCRTDEEEVPSTPKSSRLRTIR